MFSSPINIINSLFLFFDKNSLSYHQFKRLKNFFMISSVNSSLKNLSLIKMMSFPLQQKQRFRSKRKEEPSDDENNDDYDEKDPFTKKKFFSQKRKEDPRSLRNHKYKVFWPWKRKPNMLIYLLCMWFYISFYQGLLQ